MQSPAEKPEYVQRGGLWFNCWQMTWPFAKIEFFPDHFSVHNIRFSPDNLVALEEVWFLTNGIHIRHTIPNAPKRLVFWPMNMGALRREFVQRGYRIERGGFAWTIR